MDYLYKNRVNELLDSKDRLNNENLINNMVNKFYTEVISSADIKLLSFAFKDNITQMDLDEFSSSWDIEAYGGARSLILAYVKKENPYLIYPEYIGPRLSGLLNYYRFLNLKIIAHFTKLTRELNKKNIKPLLIKGGAMKHLRPDLPRVMGDTDIVTLGKDFDIACNVALDLGYEFGIDSTVHSVDLHLKGDSSGAVDIHRYIDFQTEYDKKFMKDLFLRSSEVKAFGVDVLLPCAEDLVFIGLTNLSKNLHNKTSMHGILYMLFDCKYLVDSKKDFNWDTVLKNATKANSEVQVYFAMKFLNKLVPGLLPSDIFESEHLVKNVERYCNDVTFFRFYVHDLKMRCKVMKISNAIKDLDLFKQYLKDKPRHFVLKRVRKSPYLVSLFLQAFNK